MKLKVYLGFLDLLILYQWSIDIFYLLYFPYIGVKRTADFLNKTYLLSWSHTTLSGRLCFPLVVILIFRFYQYCFISSVSKQSILSVGNLFFLLLFHPDYSDHHIMLHGKITSRRHSLAVNNNVVDVFSFSFTQPSMIFVYYAAPLVRKLNSGSLQNRLQYTQRAACQLSILSIVCIFLTKYLLSALFLSEMLHVFFFF